MSARPPFSAAAVVHRCQYVVRLHVHGRPINRPCGRPSTERHFYHHRQGCTIRDYCDQHKSIGDIHLAILADVEKTPVQGK